MWIYILIGFILLGIFDFIIRKIGAYFEEKRRQELIQYVKEFEEKRKNRKS